MRILVVTDTTSGEQWCTVLRGGGHEVHSVPPQAAALAALDARPRLVVVALEGGSTEVRRVVQRVRGACEQAVPAVALVPASARWLRVAPPTDLQPLSVLRASEATAQALLAAVARQGEPSAGDRPALTLDAARRVLAGPEGTAQLTSSQCAIAAELLAAAGALVPASALATALWGQPFLDVHARGTLRAHIHTLRRALAAVGAEDALMTERGGGYRLVAG